MSNSSTRRKFLKNSAGITIGAPLMAACQSGAYGSQAAKTYEPSNRLIAFREILTKPVLNHSLIKAPVVIDRLELFQTG